MQIKRISPITWSKDIVDNLGWSDAWSIAQTYRQPMIGKDQSEPNPHAKFYETAFRWIKQNIPESIKHQIMEQAA